MAVIQYNFSFKDPNLIRRFGQIAAASGSEVLLYPRTYAEPGAQAQRSVVSTSANDANPSGSGAKEIRVTYLNSDYVLKTEDVLLNGTNAVNTVATDIRFIEELKVIKGTAAVGAIKLMTTTGGGGTEICGIGIGTYNSFLAHHYVPAGKSGYVIGMHITSDDEVKVKLMGRATYGSNIVDEHLDLVNLMGIATPPGLLIYDRKYSTIAYAEKSYIRINVVPNQATSTTIRGELLLWES